MVITNCIISSDNLFPYIANDPSAFSFYWDAPQNLTFFMYDNLSVNFSFTYVLIDKAQISYIPHDILDNIKSGYGLLSVIFTNQSYPGNICLYKYGYSGKVSEYF